MTPDEKRKLLNEWIEKARRGKENPPTKNIFGNDKDVENLKKIIGIKD